MVSEARTLRQLPALTAAWLAGEVTGGQVRIICGQVIDRHLRLFAQHEATLSSALEDRGVLHANLDAEGYALAKEALGVADAGDLSLSMPERRGALKVVFRFFLDRQRTKTVRRQRPHVNVVINAETLGTDLPDAVFASSRMPLPSATLERLLCDCDLRRMLHADGHVLDYGRAERTAPAALYNALVARDGGCRFPECDRPPEDSEVHHVTLYAVGGVTSVDGCVLGCWSHHPVLHREGWSSALARDGTFTVTSPDGVTRSSLPRVIVLEHLRAMVGLPPTPDDDPPIVDHLREVEGDLAVRRRVNALIGQRRFVEGIVNAVSLGTRPGWELRRAG